MAISQPPKSKGMLGSKAAQIGIGFLTGGPVGAVAGALPDDSPMKRAFSLYSMGSGFAGGLGGGAPAAASTGGHSLGVDTNLGFGSAPKFEMPQLGGAMARRLGRPNLMGG